MNCLKMLARDLTMLALVVGSVAVVRAAVRVGRLIDWVRGVESEF